MEGFVKTLCNLGVFRTLAYFETVLYSEHSRWNILFRTLCNYSIYTDFWYVQTYLNIQNLRHPKYRETLKYSLHRALCNLGIFATHSSPSILKTRETLRIQSNKYDEPFSTEPCVTLAYSELETWVHSELETIQNPVKNLWWRILFRIMCNTSIHRIQGIFRILLNIYHEIFIQNHV